MTAAGEEGRLAPGRTPRQRGLRGHAKQEGDAGIPAVLTEVALKAGGFHARLSRLSRRPLVKGGCVMEDLRMKEQRLISHVFVFVCVCVV